MQTSAIVIPPAIWEQDQHLWHAWIKQSKAGPVTMQEYKRIITEFYFSMERPICECTEADLSFYARADSLFLAQSTVAHRAAIIRAYWTFAKKQQEILEWGKRYRARQNTTNKQEFAIGQKVRIIRPETWQGRICTITQRDTDDPNMYWLKEHGWRHTDEIESVEAESEVQA